MSNSPQNPHPQYPQGAEYFHRVDYTYRRSIIGPLILIVLGVLFLLGNMHVLTWGSIGWWFSRYWPAILILIGVVKLVEYSVAQHRGYRAPGIGAGGVLLIIFLVLFGLGATQANRHWGVINNEMDWRGPWGWWGQTYTYNDQIVQPFPEGSNLQVVSDSGSITVNAWDQKTIRVVVTKRVATDSQNSANRINDQTKPTITIADKLLTVNANTSAAGDGRVETDLEIYVPRAGAADVSTRRGDLTVRGRDGDVKAVSSRGDIAIDDVKGTANLTTRRGSVQASKVTGDVIVNGQRVEDTTLSDIGGEVRLNGEFFGTTKLSKIAKGVQFTSSRTDMKFGRLDGEMTMDTGELRANQLAGPFNLSTRSKDITLEDVAGDVKVENSNGEVNVQATKMPLGNIDIDNHRGEVQVTLPAKGAFQLDARAERGEIQSDFPELHVNTSGHEATAAGAIGKGGAKVTIQNQQGGVQIRKAG